MDRIAVNRIAVNRIALGIVVLLACFSASCSGADNAENEACRAKAPAGSRAPWVYYPGFGCGPLTPTGRGVFAG